ncbi:MAG: hypothetical protein AAGD25_01550 [Cyanobacteria bacterium P01_F01_bin.150]
MVKSNSKPEQAQQASNDAVILQDAVTKDLRQQHFQRFLALEANCNAENLAILDQGVANSPYYEQLITFADRLKERPNGNDVVSGSVPISWSSQPYPTLGTLPTINESGLSFLHNDIQQACVCISQWQQAADDNSDPLKDAKDQLKTYWLGRNAMQPIELWSTTKLVPILNVIARTNTQFPGIDTDNCQIRQQGEATGYSFYKLAQDIMSYDETIGTSNAIAAMFKLFETPQGLEDWLKSITGHQQLEFRGRYGEPPFFDQPELWHPATNQVLLRSNPVPKWSDNTISVYDLTRLVSMIGWHLHLPARAKLPGVSWNSLEGVVRAMGCDSARYIDEAIAQLGLASVIRSPVIISKLGYGRTSIRDRAELAYTALVQLVDKRPCSSGNPSVMHSMAFTMLSAKDYGDFDKEAVELDARMATEVTELIRRLLQSDWE